MEEVYVFALYSTVESSFGIDLEIIQSHLNKGDRVTIFTCNSRLLSCDRNKFHSNSICEECKSRSKRGISLLKNKKNLITESIGGYRQFGNSELESIHEKLECKNKLKEWYVDNFDIGYAILSSLITWRQDGNPDLFNVENIKFIEELSASALHIYGEVDKILKNHPAQRVYVFNGRYAPMRAIVRAAERNNIKYYTHDRGGFDAKHYRLFENALPHSIDFFTKDRDFKWKAEKEDRRKTIAKEWFESKARGSGGSWVSFIDGQEEKLLPESWSAESKNITVFTSSEREFGAIGREWEDRLFSTQVEGISFIKNYLGEELANGKTRIYVRVHPNQKSEITEIRNLNSLVGDGIEILSPESNVSTYELLKRSDIIFSFGSTVGIEAVYWGTPSILLGQCFYRDLNATYNPTKINDLKELLSKKELLPKPKELSYPHAFKMATFGEKYKYYSSTGTYTGTFHNKSMEPKSAISVKKIIYKTKCTLKGILKAVRS